MIAKSPPISRLSHNFNILREVLIYQGGFDMKVLLINGSPKKEGNTYTAMDKIALGKERFGLPEQEERVMTNFIR